MLNGHRAAVRETAAVAVATTGAAIVIGSRRMCHPVGAIEHRER